eukprot:TRINITY_DN11221_c0_g1_i2.p1 TRINITY_DN11221_c0_g1~~TRINITY_DN11221_c0_g1_i2.p1  ORF type:complete len:194 (+),score=49.73 TRINITY_DN11221_c0_g1_i2:189-770(+)
MGCRSSAERPREPPPSLDPISIAMTAPIQHELTAHPQDTVHALLCRIAVLLGLDEAHSEDLELLIEGQRVADRQRILSEAGLQEGGEFAVLGDVQAIKASKIDIVEAARRGDAEVVQLVCSYSPARVHEVDKDGSFPLHQAAFHNRLQVVLLLLRSRAKPDMRNKVRWNLAVLTRRRMDRVHCTRRRSTGTCR